MQQFGVYYGEIEFLDESGSKKRPSILVEIAEDIDAVYVLAVYSNKGWFNTNNLTNKFFVNILDWQFAGLDRESSVDTANYIKIPSSEYSNYMYLGKLSDRDITRIMEELQ